ncbi:hypothetical protein C900_02114 [Fulvivirga imtechensis AK7]|uniref:Uncharacterized protein n=2 Tax=Fulvivirga TaxID=396811 RepID=L8JY62_9BACT|nr:hypothetical protein C900_02114 [Fulvivirga imtechensis AK7]
MMAAVSSCTDPNADELYDLKKTNNTGGNGEVGADDKDNDAPGN